jgi:hypothetical protein
MSDIRPMYSPQFPQNGIHYFGCLQMPSAICISSLLNNLRLLYYNATNFKALQIYEAAGSIDFWYQLQKIVQNLGFWVRHKISFLTVTSLTWTINPQGRDHPFSTRPLCRLLINTSNKLDFCRWGKK